MTAQQRAVASAAAGDPLGAASLLNVRIRREGSVNGGWRHVEPAEQPAEAMLQGIRPSPDSSNTMDGPSEPNSRSESRAEPRGEIPETLLDFWHGRLKGRRFPSWSDFESEEVIDRWPNTVLLACDSERRGPRLSAAFVEALRAAKRKDAEQIRPTVDYSPQLTEWLLALGREVARLGKPIEDSELLPGLKGRVPYRVVALPLGETPFAVDHVLCHVTRD